MDSGRHSSQDSRAVKSVVGRMLNRVGRNSDDYDSEAEYDSSGNYSSDPEDFKYYEDDYLARPRKRNWQIRYDNQNYIRSMVHQDKGLHRVAQYPKKKWEVKYDDRAHVRNLAPYPVRVSIDYGDDVVQQWDVPYDNKNYILSMLAGSGISKTWKDRPIDPERANERFGHLRNPYDYEVIRPSRREKSPRRESYRFDRVERNVHDYETESIPDAEIIYHHPREQRRRSTNIYRYGDVERNVYDYADTGYPKSSSRYGQSVREPKTRFNAINKWRKNVCRPDGVDVEEAQNARNDELEVHYNQYGVEACADDYDENRVIVRPSVAKKRIVPMSFMDVVRTPVKDTNRHIKQVAKSYRNRYHDLPKPTHKDMFKDVVHYRNRQREVVPTPVHRDMYGEVTKGYGRSDYDLHPACGSLFEDIVEEHRGHPHDYGTAHEDYNEQYMEDDGSQTWISSSEKYAKIHHRA